MDGGAKGTRVPKLSLKEGAGMTDRDRRFIDEYLVDFDAKNAAIRAGYAPNTAKDAAAWIHPEHPSKPSVRAQIERRMAELSRRAGVSAERVLTELARVAFADATDIVDPETGAMRADVARDDAAAVAGVHIKRGDDFTEYDVRMYDKLRALELLGRHLGLFTDNVNITEMPVIVDDTGEIGMDGKKLIGLRGIDQE